MSHTIFFICNNLLIITKKNCKNLFLNFENAYNLLFSVISFRITLVITTICPRVYIAIRLLMAKLNVGF